MHVTEHAHTCSCAAVCLGMQVINQQVYPYAFSFPSAPSRAVLHVLHMLRSQKGQGRNYWIPKDRWSKASIISASSSLLLFSDREKPSELGTYTLIQQLFTYQRLKTRNKISEKDFSCMVKAGRKPESFFCHGSNSERPAQVFCAGCWRLQAAVLFPCMDCLLPALFCLGSSQHKKVPIKAEHQNYTNVLCS